MGIWAGNLLKKIIIINKDVAISVQHRWSFAIEIVSDLLSVAPVCLAILTARLRSEV